jgi:predicted DNA-binding protein YlxM (UPF0122 family)
MAKRSKPIDIEKDYKKVWPYNLTYEIFSEIKHVDIPVFTKIIEEELYAREADVIFCYYRDGMTLDDIAAEHSVTRERIRQIKAKGIRKLKYPPRVKRYILYSYDDVAELQNKLSELQKIVPGEDAEEPTIDALNLSVRSYNCLSRYARLKFKQKELYISQLTDMTAEEVANIRNLGKRCFMEILYALKEYGNLGLKDCCYDDFIMEETET